MPFAWSVLPSLQFLQQRRTSFLQSPRIWSPLGPLQWRLIGASVAWGRSRSVGPARSGEAASETDVCRNHGLPGLMCSQAHIRTLETLGRASGSLTFESTINAVERLACCVRNGESCWGTEDMRAAFRSRYSGGKRTGSPARDDVIVGSQETKLSARHQHRHPRSEMGRPVRTESSLLPESVGCPGSRVWLYQWALSAGCVLGTRRRSRGQPCR